MSEPVVVHVEQRSPEWELVRLGIPTSSAYGKILTPKKLALSSQAGTYRNQLLAEWIVGYPFVEEAASGYMDRGTELEPRARAFYEFERSCTVEEVGFIMTPDQRTGCSPDGLVEWGGELGGLEIKCPALHTHVGYLLDPDSLVEQYRLQVQGSLWITGREWWDLLAYNPVLPPIIRRVEPDPDVHDALAEALGTFLDDLDDCKRRLADYREQPDRSPLPGERTALLAQLERSLEAA